MSSIIIKIFFNKKISRKQKMLLYEFLTIYISSGISEFIAKYINNFILRNITFAGLYIYIYIILNNLSLNDIISLQQFNYVFILIPLLAIIINNNNLTLNNNIIISTIVESFAASVVEESLFRNLIPNNFSNKNIGIIVSGILFSIIHIKDNLEFNLIIRIIITSMLFNILCFKYKPNNILFHLLWNFITISLFKQENINGTTINNLEISNYTIMLFILFILLK